MDIWQFMKRKSITENRSAKNILDQRLRIEIQPARTDGVETVNRFVNVHLHCIVSNQKRISKILTLPPWEFFCGSPWFHATWNNHAE